MKPIGIGCPTFNRLESLKNTITSIEKFCKIPYHLYISIDGSNDGTLEWVKSKKYEYHMQPRTGVCSVKNKILKRFENYDYSFIIEDDTRLIRNGAFELYINAINKFKIHHFNFLIPQQRIKACPDRRIGNLIVMYSKLLGGVFSTFTKDIIKRVGFFNSEFKGYGYGHCEYTLRVSRAKLTSQWGKFAHLINAEHYIIANNSLRRATGEFKKIVDDKKRNSKILEITMRNSRLIYIPYKT